MEVTFASDPAPGAVNEDFVLATDRFVVVLDGSTADPGVPTGCEHDVRWFVRELGRQLCAVLLGPSAPARIVLTDALAEAITLVRGCHDGCDLSNPDSPTCTVAILARYGDEVDYLVLGDCAVVLEPGDGDPVPIVDDRLERALAAGAATRRELRNTEGGFWVAGTLAAAAGRALTGTTGVGRLRQVALLTDGAYRLVGRYSYSWAKLLEILAAGGPAALIAETRAAEASSGRTFPGKRHDDATAVLCRFAR